MAVNAGSVYAELILDTSKYEKALNNAEKQMDDLAKKLEKTGKSIEKAGDKLSKYVTVPILGVGAAATKLGMDFEAAMSEVAAISGATGEELAMLEAKAREMGATTKFSASDAAAGLKYMAMAGWDTNQMLDGLEGVMMLAAASGEDLALTADIVTDALTAFGMEAKQAGEFADLLASASSNSNTNVAMLGESFKYVAPLFGALGYSAEDAALALGLMANAGIKGSQAGTSLRSAITNLANPTKSMAEAMNELGISITDANGEMLPFKDVMDQLREKFAGLTEEQQAQYAATIFGKEAMSGMLAIINASEEDYNKLVEATRNYNGAAKEMSDIMQNNLKGRWEEFKSALEETALQIYDAILPSLEKLLEKIRGLVEWFKNLSPETQETIVKMAALAAAIGPVLSIGGKLIGGISSIIGLLGKLSIGATATTTTVASLGNAAAIGATKVSGLGLAAKAGAALLNPWTAAIVAGGLAAYGLYKHLSQDAIPAVDLFGDEVSENTQKAVGSFLELEEQATKSLNQLAWSGQEVTGEMAESIIGNFEAMKEQVVGKLEEQKERALASISEMVENSISMTEEEKEEMIRIIGESYDEQIRKTEEGNARIKEILEKAKEEKRALTEEEKNEINRIKEEMKNDGIRILSESEKEHLAIMERLKQESGKISALQAAEIVKNSKEQKEKTIAEAEKEYEERLKYAAELRASGSKEAEKMADKIVEEAKRQRDEAIKNAEEMHNKVVEQAKLQAGEHVNLVDWETGEVKTKWEVMKGNITQKAKEIKEDVTSKWREIKKSTAEKWEEIRSNISTKWDNIKTNTSTTLQEIRNNMTSKWEEIKTNTSSKWASIKENISEKARDIKEKIISSITESEREWNSKTADMEATKSRFSRLASKVTDAFGKIAGAIRGAIDAILDWNRTEPKNKTVTYTTVYETIGNGPRGGGRAISAYARGTNYHPGGLALVGEQGPELIELPRGTKVYSSQKSMDMVKSMIPTMQPKSEIHLHIGTLIADDYSLKQLERKLRDIRINENTRLGVDMK